MRKYRGVLARLEKDEKQTLGALIVFLGTDEVFECKTLELPWRYNRPFESCIPAGEYDVVRRYSETYGDHWHIKDVPGRSLILMHKGNFHRDTEGCVCMGRDYYDIDQDGYRDVTSSKATLIAMNNAIGAVHFRLTVLDQVH